MIVPPAATQDKTIDCKQAGYETWSLQFPDNVQVMAPLTATSKPEQASSGRHGTLSPSRV